ncbi:MAG TPA: hypothetical protein VI322_04895 [Candidatus Saccharimonadia bacterium]
MVELLGCYSNWAYWTKRVSSLLRATDQRPPGTIRNRVAIRKLSDEEIAELVNAYRGGATVRELGARFGVHRTTVSSHLLRKGVKVRGHSMTDSEVDQAAALYGNGLSVERIGQRLGFNGGTVWLALRNRGVQMRPASGG